MTTLPALGVGAIFVPGLEPLLAAGDGLLDYVEIEPQTFWFGDRKGGGVGDRVEAVVVAAGVDHRPALVHGVGCPVGGSAPPPVDDLANLAAFADRVDAPWVSEHLSFTAVDDADGTDWTGLLLPPPQTTAGAEHVAGTIRDVRARLDRPFAFETGVNYLPEIPGDLADGVFWRRVAEAADCGILLDLHNVWCNARNGRQPLDDLFDDLPLDRVWELHLAAGEQRDGVWLDAHDGLVDAELLAIAADLVPHLPGLRAITFEIMPEYFHVGGFTTTDVRAQLGRLHDLWDLRRPGVGRGVRGGEQARRTGPIGADPPAGPHEQERERVLAARVTDRPGEPAGDAGDDERDRIAVMQDLVRAVRRGLAVSALPLTLRLLRLELGRDEVERLFRLHWADRPPQQYADREGAEFARTVQAEVGDRVAHLGSVVAWELAVIDQARHGGSRTVDFTCEPLALLEPLGRGDHPGALPVAPHRVTVTP